MMLASGAVCVCVYGRGGGGEGGSVSLSTKVIHAKERVCDLTGGGGRHTCPRVPLPVSKNKRGTCADPLLMNSSEGKGRRCVSSAYHVVLFLLLSSST